MQLLALLRRPVWPVENPAERQMLRAALVGCRCFLCKSRRSPTVEEWQSGEEREEHRLGNNLSFSDDGAQAYGLMGWARRISDKVLVEVAPFRHIVRWIAMQQLRQRIHTMNLSCNRGSKRMTGRQVRKYQRNPKGCRDFSVLFDRDVHNGFSLTHAHMLIYIFAEELPRFLFRRRLQRLCAATRPWRCCAFRRIKSPMLAQRCLFPCVAWGATGGWIALDKCWGNLWHLYDTEICWIPIPSPKKATRLQYFDEKTVFWAYFIKVVFLPRVCLFLRAAENPYVSWFGRDLERYGILGYTWIILIKIPLLCNL